MKNFTRLLLTGLFMLVFSLTGKAQKEQQLKAPERQVAVPDSKEKISRKAIKKIKAKKEDKDKDKDKKEGEEEDEGYDGPAQAEQFQIERTKNPFTGIVPSDKMLEAILSTKAQKEIVATSPTGTLNLNWIERGPSGDSTGPSNGNTRANKGKTAGRIDAMMVDSADPSHKTVWIGGRGGGLWKTTDITATPAVWTPVNDYMGNLSMAAITQDPTNYNIMYFCTGESYNEAGALRGNGVFKSTDHGVTWAQLPSTALYYYCTRILCDYQGNVYLGTKGTGLLRSKDGGATWTNITPSGSVPDVCDLEITSTAVASRLHAVFGIFSTQSYRYTDISSTVSSAAGWIAPITPFPSYAGRAEIGVMGNVLYAAPSDPATQQVPIIYKSTDAGKNWAPTAGQPASGWASGQGWYALTVAINPANPNECFVGGLDQQKTTDGGATWTRASFWVGLTGQYVHADQHKALWYDGGTKLLFGCDGGIHFSSDKGVTMVDKNEGLRLKQFYSIAVHPTTTNYFLAGAQDNGVHKLNGGAGISASEEVTGGDGAIVAIDQNEPQYQFGSYVYSNYRRSINGGATWGSINYGNTGMFINPYDYANVDNMFYAAYSAGTYFRSANPQTTFTAQSVTVPFFNGATVSAVTTSPYTSKRVYFGTNGGRIVQIDNADAAATATNITGTGMVGYVNNVAVGNTDQTLLACFSSYGVNNVWLTTNGGTTWTACDGNLPDMPVYWAVFNPNDNNRVYIATETGVWETSLLNGANTVWAPHTTFPTVRTTMLKFRSSDNTLGASTYGRGVWSTVVCATASVTSQPASITVCNGTPVNFSITAAGDGTITYQWQISTNGGVTWTNIAGANTANYTFPATAADNGKKYRVYVTNVCASSDTSAVATLTTTSLTVGGTLSPASINACLGTNSTTLTLSGNIGNIVRWESSVDGGITWVPVANTTNTLTVTNITQTTLYRVVVQSSGCSAVNSADATINFIPTSVGPLFVSTNPGAILCAGNTTKLTVNSATTATAVMNNTVTSANGYITFNFRNNNAFAVTVTDIASVASNAGVGYAAAYYNTTALTGNPGNISIANGWNQFGGANFVGNGSLTVQPVLTGLSLVIPANTTYGIVLALTDASGLAGNLRYSNALTTGIASAGGCDIITNATIGFSGLLVPDVPTTAARFFIGSVTVSGAPAPVASGTILWSPAAGLNATNTASVDASPAVTTNYLVSVTDANGCKGNASINILVNQPPVFVIQPANVPTQCVGTVASFNVAVTGSGTNGNILSYQWQVSPDGGINYFSLPNAAPYSGVFTNTLIINPINIAMNNNRYRCVVKGICSPDAVSTGAILSVAPLPIVTLTPTGANCGGVAGTNGLPLTASGADTYTWSPATGLYTNAGATVAYVAGSSAATVYAAPGINTVYTVTGTNATTGCGATASVTVNYTPAAPTVSPAAATVCLGVSPAVPLSIVSSLQPVTQTFSSGTISVAIPDGPLLPYPAGYVFPATTTPPLAVNIPAGALVAGLSVKLNITHTYVSDLVIVLKAPNGNIFNLDAAASTSGKAGANFVNTVISSTGTNALSAGVTPGYTGVFAPDAAGLTFVTSGLTFPGGPVGYVPNVSSFSGLYSVPNGNWTLAVYDYGQGDLGTITSWSLDVTYGVASSGIWSPNTGLFTDAAATIPYTGTALNTVYAKPTASTVYNVVVNSGSCNSPAQSVPVTVNIPVSITAQPVNTTVCADKVANFTVVTTGSAIAHNWKVSTTGSAPWTDVANGGVYSGAKTATLIITAPPVSMNGYFYKDSITTSPCTGKVSDSAKLTVNILPVVTIKAQPYTKLLPGITTTLSATSSTPASANGYKWFRNGVLVVAANTNTYVVDVDHLGEYTATVTDINNCGGAGLSNVVMVSDSISGRVFIYPTPNSGQFQVRFYSIINNNNLPRGINVFDARGKRVLTKTYSISAPYARMDVDLRNQGAGVYWIEVVNGAGNRLAMGRTEVLR